MKFKKKKDQSVGASVFLRGWNKTLMGASFETKCRSETKRKAIQNLPNLGIHSRYSHLTVTLLWMLRKTYWKETDSSVFWETLPEPDKHRSRYSHEVSNVGVREKPEGAERVCNPIGRTTTSTNQTPHRSQGLSHKPGVRMSPAAYVPEEGRPSQASMRGEVLVLMKPQ